ncbi:MAG TPA: Gfo/Idh/MocA family oxidoreductase [Candidatus Dormibacteraeota bacterium]|jgi:predicted dehydrogenase|nr:Gfo/Idh/MocA family oxidoreductase [Candidatus Dormibacteraeota bacterium]
MRERRGLKPNLDLPRLALVGCGQWGLNYLRAFGELEGCVVTHACDVSPERLREAERRMPGVATAERVEEVLANPDIDAVIVAVEATRHYEVAKAVLEAGKHVLVEKPMTIEVADARGLRDIAAASGRVMMVGHVFRHNPAINYVRDVLGGGQLGDLLYLYFTRTNLGPIRSDVNAVWDLMTHDISILLHFLNESPQWVSAQGARYLSPDVEDVAFATLGFGKGVIANLRVSWLDPRKVREITLVGTRKMVVIDDLAAEPVRIYDKGALLEPAYNTFGEFKLVTHSGDVTIPAIPTVEPLKAQCQHFLDSIRSGRVLVGDADDGVRVVEVLDAINRSMAQLGAPVQFAAAGAAAG